MKTENILTENTIHKTIFLVAFPTMIHMCLETAYHIIDAIWIGMLGPVALAAIASASFFLWMIFSCCSLVEVGVNSLVARYYGARDQKSLNKVGIYGIRMGVILAFFISLTGIFSIEFLFGLLGLEPEVVDNAKCFLIPIFVGLPIFSMATTSFAVFRGVGNTRTPLKILFITLLLNTILAPLLIFGYGLVPGFGIAGGAFATIICQSLAVIMSFKLLNRHQLLSRIDQPLMDFRVMSDIAKIGLPIAFNGVIFCIVYLFLTRIISPFGTAPVAALGIGHRIEAFAYCVSVGFSIAAITLVGQNIGAKNEKRARETAWQITLYASSVMFIVSVLILIFKEQIAGTFTTDPEVISAATGYLTAIAYTEVFLAVEIVMEGVFSGMGNTLPPTIIGLPLNILRIPAAFYLAGHYGIDGIWWTIGVSTALKGILLAVWFKIGARPLQVSVP